MYATKFGINPKKMMSKLWGDNFFDASKKAFVRSNPTGKLKRGFVQFILEPIQQMIDCVINNVKNKKGNPKWKNMCKNLKIVLKNDEKELVTKKLLK